MRNLGARQAVGRSHCCFIFGAAAPPAPSLPRPLSPRGREGRKTKESFFFIPPLPRGPVNLSGICPPKPSLPRPLSPRGREGRKTKRASFFIPPLPRGEE